MGRSGGALVQIDCEPSRAVVRKRLVGKYITVTQSNESPMLLCLAGYIAAAD